MFRLNNADLRLTRLPSNLGAVCRVWLNETKSMGALLRINVYANWWINPGWLLEDIDISVPDHQGKCFVQSIGVSLVSAQIADYKIVSSANQAIADSFWLADDKIYFYQVNPCTIAKITIHTPILFLDVQSYIALLPASFSVIDVNGDLDFIQDGDRLIVDYTSNLAIGDQLIVNGELTLDPDYLCDISSFYLPSVEFLDAVDWIGKSFAPCQDTFNPVAWDFTWEQNTKIANLFIKSEYLPKFSEQSIVLQSHFGGSLTYNR